MAEHELTRSFSPVTAGEMIGCHGDRATLRDAWILIQGDWVEATIVRWRQLAGGGWAAHVLWRPGWAAWIHYSGAWILPRVSGNPPPYGPPAGHPTMRHMRT